MQEKAGETCRGQTVQAGLTSHGKDCGPFQSNVKTVDVLFHLFIYLFGRAPWLAGVPRPGIEPAPSAVKVRSPNRWTAREFSMVDVLNHR